MNEEFQILGHHSALGLYPGPVVPIGRSKQKLTAVFFSQEHEIPELVDIPESTTYEIHSQWTNRSVRSFDYKTHALFAFDRETIQSYRITNESIFFQELLLDYSFFHMDPFLRLSLARASNSPRILYKEIVQCARILHERSPNLAEQWFRNDVMKLQHIIPGHPENGRIDKLSDLLRQAYQYRDKLELLSREKYATDSLGYIYPFAQEESYDAAYLIAKSSSQGVRFPKCCLLTGETGTGKSTLAQQMHSWSNRTGPFIKVDVAAIPAELFSRELFGYTRGELGFVQQASNGTLFLDDISEISPAMQGVLLGFLDSGRYRIIGNNDEQFANIWLIAAASAPDKLRKELRYRLAQSHIYLLPLRKWDNERLRSFISSLLIDIPMSQGVPELLADFRWPGNIRQLKNVVRQILNMSSQNLITVEMTKRILEAEMDDYG